jgi:PAS domain S-box-containing protein
MAPKVFLSHDSRDEKVARVIANTLARISLDQVGIWFSSDPSPSGGIKPGQVWTNEIESRLMASRVILVLLTPNSLGRPWIYFESGYGFSNRKTQVIPLCLGITVSDVPFPLKMFQCYEIGNLESLTGFCRKLFNQLHVRFDDEMSSKFLRAAAKNLTSLSIQAKAESILLGKDMRSLDGQLEICLEMLRTMWEDLPIPVHAINETGVICGVNKRWLEVFGYLREEVIGKPADFLMTSESAELAMLLVIPEFWRRGFCQKVSYQYKKKNGELVDVLLNCIATTDENGVRTSLSFVQPIVDDRAVRKVRKESNARYRQKLLQKSVGFYETNLFGEFTSVNHYLSELLGHVKKDLLGRNYREVVDPETAKSIFNACHRVFTNRIQKSNYTWQVGGKDGKTMNVKSTISLITLPNGKAVGFRGTVQVIDDLKVSRRRVPHKAPFGSPDRRALKEPVTYRTQGESKSSQ